MSIKLDPSDALVLVTCTECTYWHACAWTIEKAEDAGIKHEENVHPESFNMRNRRATRERVRRHRAV